MSQTFNVYKDEALEAAARDAIRLDESRALLDKFVTLVRESGTAPEEQAGHYIVERLRALGVPVTLHTPELYISLPERAELTRRRRRRAALDPRASAGDGALHGRSAGRAARSATSRRATPPARPRSSTRPMPRAAATDGADPVKGRIVLTEGFSMPGPVQAFERRGAIAQIYIHPGKNIHEGICTSIWGAPTAESIGRKPTTPVVCINHPDGEALIADVEQRHGARGGQDLAARRLDALPAAGGGDSRPERPRRVPAAARPLRLLVRGHRRQRDRRRGAPRARARALGRPRSAEAQRAHRLVAGSLDRPLRRDRPGTPTPSPTRSTSTASRSSTSTRRAAPTPPPTKK